MTTARTVPLLVGCLVGIIGVIGAMLVFPKPIDQENCVTLRVNVSTEKSHVVEELADDFTRARVVNYRCTEVDVSELNSGEAAKLFMDAWNKAPESQSRPDVWLPSTSMWADLVEHRNNMDLFEGEDIPIAKSPLVIAMPEQRANVVKQRHDDIDWQVLHELANSSSSESNHPGLEDFSMGKDKATLSSSGLAATVAAHHAAAGTPEELTLDHVEDEKVTEFVSHVESSVDLYSEDSVVFLENLYKGDQENKPPYIDAMVLQEQLVYQYNTCASEENSAIDDCESKPNNPLVAIHPSDSTVVLDHPFLIVDGLGDDKRELAEQFREFLLDDKRQRRFQDEGFRDHEGSATEDLTRTAKSPEDLPDTPLERPTGGVIEKVIEKWEEFRVDVQVLLLIDVSESMAGPTDEPSKLDRVKSAVKDVLTRLDNDVRVGLWTLDEDLKSPGRIRESPLPAGQTRDKLIELVDSLNKDNTIEATPLYSGTHAAYNTLRSNTTKNEARSIVLLTDGKSYKEPRSGAEKEFFDSIASDDAGSVRIFTIAYGDDADEDTLERIATETKGVAYKAGQGNDDIEQVLPSVFKHF